MSVSVFGVRHHGPGSARSLLRALEELAPDAILIEGPPEAESILSFAADPAMKTPVSILVYDPDAPRRCAFYPFAEFSPEWQAIQFGLKRALPTRFIDLPQSYYLAMKKQEEEEFEKKLKEGMEEKEKKEEEAEQEQKQEQEMPLMEPPWVDPMGWLARAAGHEDGERWWEHMVELRVDGIGLFDAISEAMTALRDELGSEMPAAFAREGELREAHMRQSIRRAAKEDFARIAVICGAWHVPALIDLKKFKEDAKLLQGLPKCKVTSTWVPWTFGRLAASSGYGAGIESPGWYEHLWRHMSSEVASTSATTIHWLTTAARLLREKDLDASAAHVVEAVRLSESLAAMRGRPLPSLRELNDAALTVFANGNPAPLALIHSQLIIGDRLGEVPDSVPSVPLQQDLQRLQKSLRLPPRELEKVHDLDLRKETDLDRSRLLHRLRLLGIDWGIPARSDVKSKGTFRETWKLAWKPEFAIDLIEASMWGNTVESAASALAVDKGSKALALADMTQMIDAAILADLPDALDLLMKRLEDRAAIGADVGELMEALPPLVRIARYGNVRVKDATFVEHVVAGFISRICVGLPAAVASLDDEAAEKYLQRIVNLDAVILMLEIESYSESWRTVLIKLADMHGLHGLIAGRSCRMLFDAGVFEAEEVARRMSYALSRATDPLQAGAWIEGLLRGSGLVVLHAERLWQVLDDWVSSISREAFDAVLPLLRRTFASFSAPERRQMGERVVRTSAFSPTTSKNAPDPSSDDTTIDLDRAARVLPMLRLLLTSKEKL